MCYIRKFNSCFSLETKCFILGFIAFFLSMGMVASSIAFLSVRRTCPDCGYLTSFSKKFSERYSDQVLEIILLTIIVLGILWMGFSVLLSLGIWKNIPSLVLSYFVFSTMLTIVLPIGALLILLDSCWAMSLVLFLLSIVQIFCTVMVHTAYDKMQIRRGLYQRQRSESAAILVDEEENC